MATHLGSSQVLLRYQKHGKLPVHNLHPQKWYKAGLREISPNLTLEHYMENISYNPYTNQIYLMKDSGFSVVPLNTNSVA